MTGITAQTFDRLRIYVYHPRYSSDGERILRMAAAVLGRPLRHGALGALTEEEGQHLLAHFEKILSDGSMAIIRAVVADYKGR